MGIFSATPSVTPFRRKGWFGKAKNTTKTIGYSIFWDLLYGNDKCNKNNSLAEIRSLLYRFLAVNGKANHQKTSSYVLKRLIFIAFLLSRCFPVCFTGDPGKQREGKDKT